MFTSILEILGLVLLFIVLCFIIGLMQVTYPIYCKKLDNVAHKLGGNNFRRCGTCQHSIATNNSISCKKGKLANSACYRHMLI